MLMKWVVKKENERKQKHGKDKEKGNKTRESWVERIDKQN
jgi:hypothetical protein